MKNKEYSLYSGGLKGAEEAFGRCAEKYGINEINYSFEGHKCAREKNITLLSEDELKKGNISMEIVSVRMGRRYAQADKIRKVFQLIFHMVNKGYQVFAIGWIQEDKTVRGGTGWGVELAKFFNRPVNVFDQGTNKWYGWDGKEWVEETPSILHKTFCGTGTRNLSDEGKAAIEDLFKSSFS
ncbi:MAG: hypothetical protein KKE62_19255 [Proteobacteria bacterium]|nr:hypothetical protein [Pseudomonadota bacterium]MBU1390071.1 hypothetical protein [Pseudomonadota bacterium]MBU1544978.1 hypothetical protein [Pseudomonadota bacterium]MBU2430306.1 hypothetical protein [Pseudomonadota bacterium]